MTPLLALVAVLHQGIGAEEATAIARTFLRDMGTLPVGRTMGTYPVEAQPPIGQSGKAWDVVLEVSAKQWFHVSVDPRGTVYEVVLNDWVRDLRLTKDRLPSEVEKNREIARRLLAKVPHTVPVRQSTRMPGTFHASVNGRPLLNLNPNFGYEVEFDIQGRLTLFLRQDALPKITTAEPTFDEQAAKAKLENVWHETDPIAWPLPRRVQPHLGYYATFGEARLVWGGEVDYLDHGRWITMETLRTAIDATTGEPLEADIDVTTP